MSQSDHSDTDDPSVFRYTKDSGELFHTPEQLPTTVQLHTKDEGPPPGLVNEFQAVGEQTTNDLKSSMVPGVGTARNPSDQFHAQETEGDVDKTVLHVNQPNISDDVRRLYERVQILETSNQRHDEKISEVESLRSRIDELESEVKSLRAEKEDEKNEHLQKEHLLTNKVERLENEKRKHLQEIQSLRDKVKRLQKQLHSQPNDCCHNQAPVDDELPTFRFAGGRPAQ